MSLPTPSGRTYRFTDCVVTRCVDGDTFDAVITQDVGFYNKTVATIRFRMLGINSPACEGKTKEAGLKAAARLRELCEGKAAVIESHKTEKFGRWLSGLTVDGVDINALMLAEGHAVPYDGRGKRE